jgi:hypothetical protein
MDTKREREREREEEKQRERDRDVWVWKQVTNILARLVSCTLPRGEPTLLQASIPDSPNEHVYFMHSTSCTCQLANSELAREPVV